MLMGLLITGRLKCRFQSFSPNFVSVLFGSVLPHLYSAYSVRGPAAVTM